jgi:hypothetical protein
VLADAPIAPPNPSLIADPSEATRLDLAPAWNIGAQLRRQIRWTSTSEVMVSHDGHELRSSIVASVDAVVHLTVTTQDKGAAQTVEVRFESVVREAAGATQELSSDPQPGSVWSCRVDTDPVLCAVSPEETRAPPDWLTISVAPLLPARAVEPAESWSRRAGVAAVVGAGSDGVVRATVQAEAPYETAGGLVSTASFQLSGEDVTQAFGRSVPLTLTGEGAFEVNLRTHRVTAMDARWTGSASAHHTNGASHTRVTETTVRMTELGSSVP